MSMRGEDDLILAEEAEFGKIYELKFVLTLFSTKFSSFSIACSFLNCVFFKKIQLIQLESMKISKLLP